MNQCNGQLKLDICMTFKERMESQGWHNVYDKHPNESGEYKVYRRNGSIGKAHYNADRHTWKNASGWEITWWK